MTELSKSSQRELARAALARAPAFSQCASATLDRFVAEGTLRIFKRGETVSHRGGPVSNLCVLATGSVEVSATSATGKRHVLHYLESGQLFNVIGAFDGGPGIHDAIAHEETLALLIPRATLLAAVEVEPLLAMAMVRFLCLRSRALYDYIAEHTLLPLRARCAPAARDCCCRWSSSTARRARTAISSRSSCRRRNSQTCSAVRARA